MQLQRFSNAHPVADIASSNRHDCLICGESGFPFSWGGLIVSDSDSCWPFFVLPWRVSAVGQHATQRGRREHALARGLPVRFAGTWSQASLAALGRSLQCCSVAVPSLRAGEAIPSATLPLGRLRCQPLRSHVNIYSCDFNCIINSPSPRYLCLTREEALRGSLRCCLSSTPRSDGLPVNSGVLPLSTR